MFYQNKLQYLKKQQIFYHYLQSINRQIIARFISKKNGLTGIQIINALGGISLITIAVFTFTAFISMVNRLEIDKNNFILVNWMSGINSVLSISNTNLAAQKLIQLGFYTFQTDEAKQDLQISLQNELYAQNKKIKQLMSEIYQTNSLDQIVFQNIIGNPAQQILYSGSEETIRTINSSFIYELVTQTAFISLQNNKIDPQKIFQHNAELNFQPLNSLIYNVTLKIDANFQQRSIDQSDSILYQIIIFSSISFLFALSVIPTYRFIMKKQSNILQLFATIEPEKINIMVQNLKFCQTILNNSNSRTKLLKFNKMNSLVSIKSLNNSLHQLQKKKNINRTIPLRLSYVKIIFIVLVFFVGLQIQPIADYVISSRFFNNCKDRYKLVSNLIFLNSSFIL